jgi:hypothetical protein
MWRTSLRRPFSLSRISCGDMLHARGRFLLVAYALVLSIEAGANVWINFVGKGNTWDLYPLVAPPMVFVARFTRRTRE